MSTAILFLAAPACGQPEPPPKPLPIRVIQKLPSTELAVVTINESTYVYWPHDQTWARVNVPHQLHGPFALSPNGRYLLTTFWDEQAPEDQQACAFLTDLLTGRYRAIYHRSGHQYPTAAVWTPDGKTAYFSYDEPNKLHFNPSTARIMCYDLASRKLTEAASIPKFHVNRMRMDAQGKRIVADVLLTGANKVTLNRLCVIDLQSSEVSLPESLDRCGEYGLNGDGTELYFYSYRENESLSGIRVINFQSGNIKDVFFRKELFVFAPSPCGNKIALTDDNHLSVLDVAAKTLTPLKWTNGQLLWPEGVLRNPVWSKDARYLAGHWGGGFYAGKDWKGKGMVGVQYCTFIVDFERQEAVELGTLGDSAPVYIIEDSETVTKLKETWWAKESIGNYDKFPKAILEEEK